MVSMDYELMEEQLTVLVAKDECTGAILAYDCLAKGPSDVWALKQQARHPPQNGWRTIDCGCPKRSGRHPCSCKDDPMQSAYI